MYPFHLQPYSHYLYPYSPVFSGQRERKIREDLLHDRGCQCARCKKQVDFYQADLHHTDPRQKRFTLDQRTIGKILDGEGEQRGMIKILKEFAKTILLCRPCHVDVHKTNDPDYFDDDYLASLKGKTRKLDKNA